MARARCERDSVLMSLVYANVRLQIAKNKPKALKPDDFNPFAKTPGKIMTDITALKAMLPAKQKKK